MCTIVSFSLPLLPALILSNLVTLVTESGTIDLTIIIIIIIITIINSYTILKLENSNPTMKRSLIVAVFIPLMYITA